MKTAYDIILEPVISERSMDIVPNRKYTFKVAKDATKTEIKQAVEELFEVTVTKVTVANYDGKKKRMGRYEGRTSAYKKAVVTISADSKEIEFFQSL
ncbi:MAG: 50S ribosomal protein L23 [Eubacterium sp.]|jgi:large subunit ribosomal protein L23